MVNIHLENAIREFVSACFLARVEYNDKIAKNSAPEFLSSLSKLGSVTLGRMTGLTNEDLLFIMKDELTKIAHTLERTRERNLDENR